MSDLCTLQCGKGHIHKARISKLFLFSPEISSDEKTASTNEFMDHIVKSSKQDDNIDEKSDSSDTNEQIEYNPSQSDVSTKSTSDLPVTTEEAASSTSSIVSKSADNPNYKFKVDISSLRCEICDIETTVNFNKYSEAHVMSLDNELGPKKTVRLMCKLHKHVWFYSIIKRSKHTKPGCAVCLIDRELSNLGLQHLNIVPSINGNVYSGDPDCPIRINCSKCRMDFVTTYKTIRTFVQPMRDEYCKEYDEIQPGKRYRYKYPNDTLPQILSCKHRHQYDKKDTKIQLISLVRLIGEILDEEPYDDHIFELWYNQPSAYNKNKNIAFLHLATCSENTKEAVNAKCKELGINLIQIPQNMIKADTIILHMMEKLIDEKLYKGDLTKVVMHICDALYNLKIKAINSLQYQDLSH